MIDKAIRVMTTNAEGGTREYVLLPGEDIISTYTIKVAVNEKIIVSERSVAFKFLEFVELSYE